MGDCNIDECACGGDGDGVGDGDDEGCELRLVSAVVVVAIANDDGGIILIEDMVFDKMDLKYSIWVSMNCSGIDNILIHANGPPCDRIWSNTDRIF